MLAAKNNDLGPTSILLAPPIDSRTRDPERLWRLAAAIAVLLPLGYVASPLIRLLGASDDGLVSYGPVLFLLLLAAAVAGAWRWRRGGRLQGQPLDWLVAILALYSVLSAAGGLALHHPRGLVAGDLFQIVEFCGFYLIVRALPLTRRSLWVVAIVIAGLSLACVVLDAWQVASYWRSVGGFIPRIPPDGIRALPGLLVPALFALMTHARWRTQLVLVPLLLVLVVWMLFSLTRGLWVAAAAGFLFVIVFAGGWRRRGRLLLMTIAPFLVIGVLAAPAVVAFNASHPGALYGITWRYLYTPQQILHPANAVEERRLIEFQVLAPRIAKRPLFGYGLGAEYIGPTGYTAASTVIGPRHFIHDTYLAVAYRLGLLGLALVLAIAGLALLRGLRAYRARPAEPGSDLLLAQLAFFVGVAFYSLTADSLMRHPSGMFVALALAAVGVLRPRPRQALQAEAAPRPDTAPNQVAVTIISHSHRMLLHRAVSTALAALKASGLGGRCFVLDNASTDGSAPMVAREFPDVELLARQDRYGFGANQNELFRACGADYRYVLMLNDDAELPPDAIARLVRELEVDPAIAALAPVLVYPEGRFQTAGERLPSWSYHVLRHAGVGRHVPSGLRRRLGSRPRTVDVGDSKVVDTGYVAGACVMIRTSAIEHIGGFDERFLVYGEDADWCKRAWEAGWRVSVLSDLEVIHHRNQSWSAFSARERERSMFLYLQKHGTGQFKLGLLRAVVLISHGGRLGLLALARAARRRDAALDSRIGVHREIIQVALNP